MNQEESYQEIASLLRSRSGYPQPSPGLESKILRALAHHHQPAPRNRWAWIALPVSLAAVTLILLTRPPGMAPAKTVAADPVQELPSVDSSLSGLLVENALSSEVSNLGRDAERAGNFLINCLPSIQTGHE